MPSQFIHFVPGNFYVLAEPTPTQRFRLRHTHTQCCVCTVKLTIVIVHSDFYGLIRFLLVFSSHVARYCCRSRAVAVDHYRHFSPFDWVGGFFDCFLLSKSAVHRGELNACGPFRWRFHSIHDFFFRPLSRSITRLAVLSILRAPKPTSYIETKHFSLRE